MRILLLVCAALLAACDKKAPPPPAAPAEVAVQTLRTQPVSIITELPGRVVSFRMAEVRPQVNGVILKRMFNEGSEVAAGQQLYQIDPAPFAASLGSARATLARAQATANSTRLLAERYKPLSEARAVSRQDYDNAVASADQAAADVASGESAVQTARINLAYTRVLAPIAGRTGRSAVTEGALVAANQATSLLVIQQLDPIYVDVTQASSVLLHLQRALAEGHLKQVGTEQAEARLVLEDGSTYSEPGKLQFSEVTVDSGTGSVTLRAVFPNPKHILLPGMFVREHLEEGVREAGLLVPQRAVARNQRGEPTVLVVGADNRVSVRILKTERAIGDQWLVNEGVTSGEKIVVVGLQRAKPGSAVNPHEVTPADLEPAPNATAAPKKQ